MGIEDRVERILKKLKLNRFAPFPFARSGFWQTIYGSYWPILKPSKPDRLHYVQLPDGDILVMAENRPKDWRPGKRIMLLVHGLTGSDQATYMQRMCRRLYKKGYMVLRLNLRFCGPGRGLSKRAYHCGASEDPRYILEWLKREFPDSPVTQIGFSLGGALTLKLAGEDGSRPSGNLDSAVSVSPPVDLTLTAGALGLPENRLFEKTFLRYLRRDIELMNQLHPGSAQLKFTPDMTIRKFDELYTAPTGGFKDAADYYKQCSASQFIPEIKIPTLIVTAIDDPVAGGSHLHHLPHNDNVDTLITEHGGHVGFLGFGTSYEEVRWSDQAITRWLEDTIAI